MKQLLSMAEKQAMAVTTGVTNLAMLPCLVLACRYRLPYQVIVGAMTMLTSSAYHVCESLDFKLFGFNFGRWHHIDNVFAITSLMCLICGFLQFPRGTVVNEAVHTCSICISIV